jgi:hypothetical protein
MNVGKFGMRMGSSLPLAIILLLYTFRGDEAFRFYCVLDD